MADVIRLGTKKIFKIKDKITGILAIDKYIKHSSI